MPVGCSFPNFVANYSLFSMASKNLINLHFIAGQLCVWHADEVQRLRSEHHIVGSLIGALPGAPRQNAHLGLPLQLMPEEAAVLLQHGVARLVTMSVAKPSKLQVKEFNQQRMDSIKEQKLLWQDHQVEQKEHLKEVIEEGRRRKKEKRKQVQQDLTSTNVKEEREVAPMRKDDDPDEREKGPQETCPEHESLKSRRGDREEVGKNHIMKGDEDIDRRVCELDAQQVGDREEVGKKHRMKGDEDIDRRLCELDAQQVGDREEVGKKHRMKGDEDIDRRLCELDAQQVGEGKGIMKCNDETRENIEYVTQSDRYDGIGKQEGETKRNSIHKDDRRCGASKLHENESSVPRNRTLVNEDEGKGVTEERQCTISELKGKKADCAGDAVVSSSHVVSECFADEENDDDGKNEEERRRKLSLEDSVKEDGCSVQVLTAEPVESKFILEAPPSAWRYPSSDREKLKCRVFQHFWEMGYYLTSGTKFGGDFLVYPGDPLLFHSYFIVVCIPYHKQLSPLELISHGRLGTFVKKAVVLCSVDSHNEVVCTSLQWSGLS